jgi:hypothetical protein
VGKTRTPPPGMTAYEAGRLATAARRSPEAERRLYDDALAIVEERLRGQLRALPPAAAR